MRGKYINILYIFAVVMCTATAEPCKQTDTDCLNKALKQVLGKVITGIPALGIETSDPQYVDLVEADIANLKYNFTDSTLIGYSNCEVNSAKLSLERSNLRFNMACALEFSGDYIMKGRLIILPVEGEGKFRITSKKTQITVDAEVKKVEGADGTKHLNIKKFTVEVAALEKSTFDFENLFNGNKVLSDGVHQFANDNYMEVTKEVSNPVYTVSFRKMFKNVNKYLKTVPLHDLVQQ